MIFDVPALIEFLSGGSTLLPGTVILTGTPEGIGMTMSPPSYLAPGDWVEVKIEKIVYCSEIPWSLSSRRSVDISVF